MNKYCCFFAMGFASALLAIGASTAAIGGTSVGRPAVRPAMGWSTWSFLRGHPTEKTVMAQARALHSSGLQRFGYNYINLDDFWYECPGKQGPDVDSFGRWIVDPSSFPPHGKMNGIEALAHYVHHLGLKFGIYSTPGISKQAIAKNTRIKGTRYTARQIAEPDVRQYNYNCGGMVAINHRAPGAQAYIDSIVARYAAWGVDYIKLDGITNGDTAAIKAWAIAIARSGRHMRLDVTDGTFTTAIGGTLDRYAYQWEPAPDIECYCGRGGSSFPLTSWAKVRNRFDYAAGWQWLVRPGHYNDFDSVDVGNGKNDGLTPNERKTVLSLWSLGASPLILGSDLTQLKKKDLPYLENEAVIEVDQDGIAAKRVVWSSPVQVFAKTERSGKVIFGFFNLTTKQKSKMVKASIVGLSPAKSGYTLTNLWSHATRNVSGPMIQATVPAHGVVLYSAVVNNR